MFLGSIPFSLPDEASGRNVVEIVFVLPVFVLKCLHSHHPMSFVNYRCALRCCLTLSFLRGSLADQGRLLMLQVCTLSSLCLKPPPSSLSLLVISQVSIQS